MNGQLKEINEILSLCDSIVKQTKERGTISVNQDYEEYKRRIKAFLGSRGLIQKDYGPYRILEALYYSSGSYTLNQSEAKAIREAVINLKHELFPNSFEKVFISHREKDAAQVAAFIDLLYAIGIPRPTVGNDEDTIFCTSHPSSYIDNGKRNMDEIRERFNCPDHTFFIMWYTDNYFESQACLNEAGAIWATNKKYQEILMPGFACEKIGGLLDKQPVWFRANDKFRLNTFREQMEELFGLDPLTQNAWEIARDAFIARIEALADTNVNHI